VINLLQFSGENAMNIGYVKEHTNGFMKQKLRFSHTSIETVSHLMLQAL
jgi:hypothetical protein